MTKNDNVTRARKAITARKIKLEREKLPPKVRAKLYELGLIRRTEDEYIEHR